MKNPTEKYVIRLAHNSDGELITAWNQSFKAAQYLKRKYRNEYKAITILQDTPENRERLEKRPEEE